MTTARDRHVVYLGFLNSLVQSTDGDWQIIFILRNILTDLNANIDI